MVEKEKYQEWIDYLRIVESDSTYFLRFAILWLSFACWLNQKYPNEKYERGKLEEFKKHNLSIRIYKELFNNDDSFRDKIEFFSKTKMPKREFVIDISKSTPNEVVSQSFKKEEMENLGKYMEIVYLIRCNFFHGRKLPSGEDEDLIKWAYETFLPLWKRFVNEDAAEKAD